MGCSQSMILDIETATTSASMSEGALITQERHQLKGALRMAVRIGIFLLMLLIPGARNVALIGLGIWAILGTRQAIQAMTLLTLLKFLNSALYGSEGTSGLWMWFVLFIAATRIYISAIVSRALRHPVLPKLLIFSTIVLFEAIFLSYYPAVSTFKLLSFLYVAAAILLAFRLNSQKSLDWSPWFVGMWIAVTVLSVPTLLVHEIGYFRDGEGFQGILFHPQTFAVFLAPGVAWLLGRTMFSTEPTPVVLYTITAVALVFIYLTRARTAVVAIIASLIVIALIAQFGKLNWRIALRRRFSHPLVIGLGFLGMASLFVTSFSGIVIEFALKNSDSGGISEAFEKSRGFSITESWLNFVNNPLFGIGFGVSFADYFMPVIEPVTGFPLSAPTEKGLLPIVVLEETGIVGSVFFLLFLFVLIKYGLSYRKLAMPLMFLTCLFVNIGEMIFFSMGGLGLYIWLLIGWATSTQVDEVGADKPSHIYKLTP